MMSHWDLAILQVLGNNCGIMGHDRAGEGAANKLQNGWFFPVEMPDTGLLGIPF